MTAYYNEIDHYAATWLRNLIDAGLIARGVVDERSIEDVHPSDLEGFTQCHFFAGVGVWSLALRRAGWPDDRPVWTGSCPCQPFSAAGQGGGFDDERHLWPHLHWLIAQRRPAIVLGEQVASKDADSWIDLVCADLEALGYAFGAVPFPSAGVGAPHIRDRLYWVADTDHQRRTGQHALLQRQEPGRLQEDRAEAPGRSTSGRLGHAHGSDTWRDSGNGLGAQASSRGRGQTNGHQRDRFGVAGGTSRLGDAECDGLRGGRRPATDLIDQSGDWALHADALAAAGPTNGLWRDADWLLCRDGKWRPVEPGSFPLAHGAPARVGRLRAYGNAINAEAARVFIEAVMEAA